MVLLPQCVTARRVPSGEVATILGRGPVSNIRMISSVSVSITAIAEGSWAFRS